MHVLEVLVLSGVLALGDAGYFFVIAPNQLRFHNNETVLISVFEENNLDVQVWLEHDKKIFSQTSVRIPSERSPVTTTVYVDETDIFSDKTEEKPRSLKLVASSKGQRKEFDIRLSYNTGYMVVHTDKPIYTPAQKVTVRTLTLDETFKGASDWNVSMEIISPRNMASGRISRTVKFPFFRHDFNLPGNPDLGVWTIKAFYRGHFETESRATFEVKKYVLPTFGVSIDVDTPVILNDTNEIKVDVVAEYVYKKRVNGKVRLDLYLKDNRTGNKTYISTMRRKQLSNGQAQFTIAVKKDILERRKTNIDFPNGKYLRVEAYVFEEATAKEESAYIDDTIFSNTKYYIEFVRSQKTFRPGYEFYLKVDMFLANGQRSGAEEVVIKTYVNGVEDVENRKSVFLGKNGQIEESYGTSSQNRKLEFEVLINDDLISKRHEVVPYQGGDQVQVEQIVVDGRFTIRVLTNTQGGSASYTGMLFVVVTRGSIVWTDFVENTNQKSFFLKKELLEKISPSARALVFYVNKESNKVIADSVRFEVEKKCRGSGLTLENTKPSALAPGESDILKITGSPLMVVGINAIDKSLLLLNSTNILTRNKMFETLEEHDLGCGEESGTNVEEVIKNTGLTMLSDALIVSQKLVRTSEICESNKRRKRSLKNCQTYPKCCKNGLAHAKKVVDSHDRKTQFDAYVECYSAAKELALEDVLPIDCIIEYYKQCKTSLENYHSEIFPQSRTFGDDSYTKDLNRLGRDPLRRTDFRESITPIEITLNKAGYGEALITFPQSITDWRIQAIGISPEEGMCIAEPLNRTVFKNFFIQLDLPYKAVRLEHIAIKATVFSYGISTDPPREVTMYILGSQGICSNARPNKQSPRTKLLLPPNSGKTVFFPIIPLTKGELDIVVTAFAFGHGVSESDKIEKTLHVVNEGVEMIESIHICLDPGQMMKDCDNSAVVETAPIIPSSGNDRSVQQMTINLVPQADGYTVIPDTVSANAFLSSNIMDTIVEKAIVENVDSLIQKPGGCVEQNLRKLTPTVYAMAYLKATKKVTENVEKKGNKNVREGVIHEDQYRLADGSYSVYRRGSGGNTWGTAYVTKVYCQAKAVVTDSVKDQNIVQSVDWLISQQRADGSFITQDYFLTGTEEIRRISGTAFIMITLLECPSRNDFIKNAINKSMTFLESTNNNTLRNNPYVVAISTYALALGKSTELAKFFGILQSLKRTDGKNVYWGASGSTSSIETTSYVLLATLLTDDLNESGNIVRWLINQRSSSGSFGSTKDTMVALQALSQYNIRTYNPEVNLDVKISAEGWAQSGLVRTLTNEHSQFMKEIKNLPVGKQIIIEVKGRGTGHMTIDLRYNRPAIPDERCPFNISEVDVRTVQPDETGLRKLRNCDACGCEEDNKVPNVNDDSNFNANSNPLQGKEVFGRKKRNAENNKNETCIRFTVKSQSTKIFGMSIIEIDLETGVKANEIDLKKLVEDNPVISYYEVGKDGEGFVVLYIDKIGSDAIKVAFRIKDDFKGDKQSRQPAAVNVYDYYSPELKCATFFITGPNRGQPLRYECGNKEFEKNCKCLQSICAKNHESLLTKKPLRRHKPMLKLLKYTCSPAKSNYAILVLINSTRAVAETKQKMANATVKLVFNRGIEPLEQGSEITFTWKMDCGYPFLEKGKEYYIIAKDGAMFNIGNKIVYRYPLMKSAIVLEKRVKPKKGRETDLKTVMTNYEKHFKKGYDIGFDNLTSSFLNSQMIPLKPTCFSCKRQCQIQQTPCLI